MEPKRLFIDSDIVQQDELRSSQRAVYHALDKLGVKFKDFDEVIGFAWHKPEEAWEAVKRCDEIYANTSLFPLIGGSYSGAPVVMNVMCKKAITEKVEGKSVFILRPFDDLEWDMIDLKLFKSAFKKNKIFSLEYKDHYEFVPIKINKIKK